MALNKFEQLSYFLKECPCPAALHIGMLASSNVRESLEEELRTARSNVQKVQATMSDAEMNTEELQIQIANLQKERGMSNVVCEGVEADLLKARSESTDSSAKTKSDLAKWPFTKQPLSKNDKVSEMALSYTS
jgi:hypothetical protein